MSLLSKLLVPAAAAEPAPVTPIYAWREAADRRRIERRPIELVEKAGWPAHAMGEARRADPAKPCIVAVAELLAEDAPWLVVLSGPVGCGKTVAAAWLAARKMPIVEFVTTSDYVQASRYDGARHRWKHADALVLDEMGIEYLDEKGAALADLTELVNEFYSRRRLLLMTTNLDGAAFKARYGARIEDRIREVGGWRSFKNAPSLRRGDHGGR